MINVQEGKAIQRVYAATRSRRVIPYVRIKERHMTAKRIFDVIFSLLVIICLLSWLLPICFILIKLDSKGPVLFRQRRTGLRGKPFSCVKLRTMIVNNLSDIKQASIDDSRITKVGKFLRIVNIDELPQFFNVLLGDMSIVGPRPHMDKDCEDFAKVVSSYNIRHSVKPGITGVAQVKGFRGPTDDIDSIVLRYQWDVFYVRNINFLLDLKIIALTVQQTMSALLGKKRREGEVIETSPTLKVQPQIASQREYRKKMIV